MRGLLAVARREIEEKRFVFGAAAIAGVIPLLVPLVRDIHGRDAADMRTWVALILAATFGIGLAVAMGLTVLASDLAERRMAFYFSRPLSGVSLWGGKLLTACLLALVSVVIVVVPMLVANGRRIFLQDLTGGFAGSAVLVAVLVLFFHAFGVVLRPRSPLLLLDAAALALVSLGAYLSIERLLKNSAESAVERMAMPAFITAVGAVALAGFAAIERGRTDQRRAHLALSVVLWPLLGGLVVALAGYSQWVLTASPRDLDSVDDFQPAPRGSWVVVEGSARGASPVFLLDTASGRFQRVGADWRRPVLSPDGGHAVWFESQGRNAPYRAIHWALNEESGSPIPTKIFLPTFPGVTFLSQDARRLALRVEDNVSILDLESGASLGSARVGGKNWEIRGFFVGEDLLRLYRDLSSTNSGVHSFEILEFDVGTKTLKTTGSFESFLWFAASPAPEHARLITHAPSEGYCLRDGRTGAVLARLLPPVAQGTKYSWARFASDGRIVVPIAESGSVRIEVFSADGRHERTILMPGMDRMTPGGEPVPGQLFISASRGADDPSRRTLFLVDLATGEAREAAKGLFPVAYNAGVPLSHPNDTPAPGSEATKLFVSPGGALVRFDPLTGQRRVILGKSDSR